MNQMKTFFQYQLCTQKLENVSFAIFLAVSFQVVLLDSSLQLLPPVLVIPSPSDVLLLGTGMESPSGE